MYRRTQHVLKNCIKKVLDTYLNIEIFILPPDEESDNEKLSESESDN